MNSESVLDLVLSGLLCASVIGLCGLGILLSCFSLSGTWLIALAALICAWGFHESWPWLWIFLLFVAISTVVEVLEAVAASWGVKRRGGSFRGGLAAIVGGLLGFALGAWIPIPVIGSLAGMLAGTFILVFLVERQRLRGAEGASDIAAGALTARVLALLMKVIASVGMSAGLTMALAVSR